MLIETLPGFALSDVVRSWKSFTAMKANRVLERSGRLWVEDYFDRYVRDEIHRSAAMSYIEHNPVDAGLVRRAQEWRWGSVRAGAA